MLDDNDFYPWGGAVPGVGMSSSNNHYKFTGKERDTESGLDYFGARYYANITGRFLTPDWSAKPVTVPYADLNDPQSFNLYSYVKNRPTKLIDLDGHDPDPAENVKTDTKDDGSSTTTQKETDPERSRTVGVGGGTFITITETDTTTTTTARDANGAVTSVTFSVTRDTTVTSTDRNGNTQTLTSDKGQKLGSVTLAGDNLKTEPKTLLARIKNRDLADDADAVPVVGTLLKKLSQLFGLHYSDFGSLFDAYDKALNDPNIDHCSGGHLNLCKF